MSSVQEAYEQVSYPHYVHPLTDPARLAAIGRLLRVHAAEPRAARVLDIGCGSGTNLLAMAERLPDSEFVGIDFAAGEIESARALAAEAGLENVRFKQADLLSWEAEGEQFDYIIAYGLFSWVPDEVKDRLFQVCRECLAPNGIACVSYMTYPGCKQAEALRDLLRLQTESCGTAEEKVAIAHQVLGFLERAYERLPNWPHSSHVRDQVSQIRRKEPHFLLLDDLGVERDPCYLLQFANWAAEHELRYLGESEFHMMFLENLPPESAQELAAMGLDRLQTEQMIDYVVNRSFRCSLLVGPDAGDVPRLNASALDELCVKPVLVPDGLPDLDPAAGRFRTNAGVGVTLRSEPLVAFSRALAARPGSFTPFSQILGEAQKQANRRFTDTEVTRLREDLLSLFVRRQLEVSAVGFTPPADLPERPQLTPLNFAAAKCRGILLTAAHEACRISTAERAFCALLDGTCKLPELSDSPAGRVVGRKLAQLLDGLRRTGCLVG